jgi:cell division protein FtsQ
VSTGGRRRARLKLVGAALACLALLGGAWLWVRDSSLVAVQRVSITGVSGTDAGQIRSALTLAARNMTTLDVRLGALRTAVAPYPVVQDLRVSTQFPHGLRIEVVEHLPVGAVTAGGRSVAAASDGTVLRDVPTGALPAIPMGSLPGGSRVTDPSALQALALLAATPQRLLAKISQVTTSPPHGLVAQLRSGPSVYFGDDSDLAAKWVAATEVLGDSSSAGASYIDVTDPARPAAGVSAQAVVAAGLAPTGSTAQGQSSSTTSQSSAAGASSSSAGTPASSGTGTGG